MRRRQQQQHHQPDIVPRVAMFPVGDDNHQEEPPVGAANPSKKSWRVSGPYENVSDDEGGRFRRAGRADGGSIREEGDPGEGEDGAAAERAFLEEGMTSIRKMLAVAQTSDV